MILDRTSSDAMSEVELIKDGTTEKFEADVILVSQTVPVIVDFWAPWCGPCKQLGPALEKVVRSAGGAVRMVKINIDDNQALAAQLRIQSVPTVYGFVDGQPVDGFAGAQPESQLRAFVEKLARQKQSPIESALAEAKTLTSHGQYAAAIEIYAQILGHDPTHSLALSGLLSAYIAVGQLPQAFAIWDTLSEDMRNKSDLKAVKAALTLADQAAQSDGNQISELTATLEQNPQDHQTRFDLALALMGTDDGAVIDHLITIVRQDQDWKEGGARKQLLTLFDAWGATDPRTLKGRRRLSSVLFC